ncbi:MAG: hypothetical protein KDN05_15885, partial [Verrucomicrobiae bacterium]|nr:hypothetical protein [Verrucomicrobiae bacterium]
MKLRFIPFTCLAFLYAATASGALPEIPDNDAGASLWKSKRRQAIESVLSGEAGLRIPQLGEMLRQLTTLRYRSSPEKDEIVGLLRQSLVSIPGHAEYYRDRLLNAQEEMKRTYGNPT